MSYQVFAFPVFQPAVRIISSITNSSPAVITTTFAPGQINDGNQYMSGMVIRLDIPREYGMQQANQLFGHIEVISDNSFAIDIDTTLFDLFTVPLSPQQYAQSVPIADSNDNTFPASVRNVLPYTTP